MRDYLQEARERADTFAPHRRSAPAAGANSSTVDGMLVGTTATYGGIGERLRTASERQVQHFDGWNHAAIRPIAQRIAGQPIRVARLRARGKKEPEQRGIHKSYLPDNLKEFSNDLEPVRDHKFLSIMNKPNDIMVRWVLVYVTICSLELTGRAYWLMKDEKGGNGQIWPLPTPWVTPKHNGRPFSGWTVNPYNSGKEYDYKAESIRQFFYPDPSDPLGCISPTQKQARAIAADQAIQTCQERSFRNGIFPGIMLTVGRQNEIPGVTTRPKLTADQRRDIIYAVKRMYQGVLRYDEPLILDALIEKVEKLSHVPREMDYLNSGKQTKARIVQGYGLTPFIMGELEGANRATAVVAESHFVANVLNPKIDLISQNLTSFVLPLFDKDPTLVAYIEPCRANDPEMEIKERDQLIKSGSLMRDELRQHYDLPPLPGGAGKTIILMPGQAIVPSDTSDYNGKLPSNNPVQGGTKPANGQQPKPGD